MLLRDALQVTAHELLQQLTASPSVPSGQR